MKITPQGSFKDNGSFSTEIILYEEDYLKPSAKALRGLFTTAYMNSPDKLKKEEKDIYRTGRLMLSYLTASNEEEFLTLYENDIRFFFDEAVNPYLTELKIEVERSKLFASYQGKREEIKVKQLPLLLSLTKASPVVVVPFFLVRYGDKEQLIDNAVKTGWKNIIMSVEGSDIYTDFSFYLLNDNKSIFLPLLKERLQEILNGKENNFLIFYLDTIAREKDGKFNSISLRYLKNLSELSQLFASEELESLFGEKWEYSRKYLQELLALFYLNSKGNKKGELLLKAYERFLQREDSKKNPPWSYLPDISGLWYTNEAIRVERERIFKDGSSYEDGHEIYKLQGKPRPKKVKAIL